MHEYELLCFAHSVLRLSVRPTSRGSDENHPIWIWRSLDSKRFWLSLDFQGYILNTCFPFASSSHRHIRLLVMTLEDSIVIANAVRNANGDHFPRQPSKAEWYWGSLHSGLCCPHDLRILWVTSYLSASNFSWYYSSPPTWQWGEYFHRRAGHVFWWKRHR
jgi:hypothetical protein